MNEIYIVGTSPTIIASPSTRYVCETVNTLNFTPCQSGICSVRFTAGSNATLTLPETLKMPDWWAGVVTNAVYEITVTDGTYAEVNVWTDGGTGAGNVLYNKAQTLTDVEKRQARKNIDTEITPEGSITNQIATMDYAYQEANGRQVTVTGNHIILARRGSGSTYHGRSVIGAPYSTSISDGASAVNTAAHRATTFKAMYNAGAYVSLDRDFPLIDTLTSEFRYYFRFAAWESTETTSQSASIMFATYDPDTDTVTECGLYGAMSYTVDGTTKSYHPLFRVVMMTDEFVEAINKNHNLMALLCIQSGGSVGAVLHLVWDIEVQREYHTSTDVSGTDPVIEAKQGRRYVCTSASVSTLSFTPSTAGISSVRFKSGTTATLLTITPPSGKTMKWPGWFDPEHLEASRTYEISIADGEYGVVTSWTT